MAIKREVSLSFKSKDGRTMTVAYEVYDGESAFEVWKHRPGNGNKTEVDFFNSLIGPRGDGVASVTLTVQTV